MWYDTGTVAVANGSTIVTGTGTNFISGAQIGEAFLAPDDKLYEIQSITSATTLVLADSSLDSTQSGQDYKIIPTQSLVADLSSGVADLISDFADVRDYAGNGKFDDGTQASPAITFTQDQNNGLYRIGSDNWGMSAGGQFVADVSTNGVGLPDSKKLTFGASDDLQIYHDGSDSSIDDAGPGRFAIRGGASVSLQNYAGGLMLKGNAGSDTLMYHNGSAKLATTSTGVDVTGTVTADGLVVDGAVDSAPLVISTAYGTAGEKYSAIRFNNKSFAGGDSEIRNVVNGASSVGSAVEFHTEHTGAGDLRTRLNIANNGDVYLYEDTGTTAKFFWDASAESLNVEGRSTVSNATDGVYIKYDAGVGQIFGVDKAFAGWNDLELRCQSGTQLYLDTSGNVGIGTASPETTLEIAKGDRANGTIFSITNTLSDSSWGSGDVIGGIDFRTDDASASHRVRAGIQAVVSGGTSTYPDEVSLAFSTADGQNAATEAMRIDSSGNVGIGTASPSFNLQVADATESTFRVNQDGTGASALQITAGNGFTSINSTKGGQALTFGTSNTERARIDSSGNLLVGTTAFPTDDNNALGIGLKNNGELRASANNIPAAHFKRASSDGDIVVFRKDSATPIGSIGSYGSTYLTVGNNSSGLSFIDAGSPHSIRPHNVTTNLPTDDFLNLGSTDSRFKDLYLSGGVFLGGTGAANKLDDYEEGTCAPVFADAISGGNVATAAVIDGTYTKVGRLVTVSMYALNLNTTGMTGSNDLIIRGLPFTAQTGAAGVQQGSVVVENMTFNGYLSSSTINGADYLVLLSSATGAQDLRLTVSAIENTGSDVLLTITYQTAA